jgi:hypothetical protein
MQQPSPTPAARLAESVFTRLVSVHNTASPLLIGCTPILLDSCRFHGFPEAGAIEPSILEPLKLRLKMGPVLAAIVEASFSNSATASNIFSNARNTLAVNRKDGLDWLEDLVLKVVQTACLTPDTITQAGEMRSLFLDFDSLLAGLSQGYLKVADLARAFIIVTKRRWQDQATLRNQTEPGILEALLLAFEQGRLWVEEHRREPEMNIRLAIHGYPAIAQRLRSFNFVTDYARIVADQIGLRPVLQIESPKWQEPYSALETGAAAETAA